MTALFTSLLVMGVFAIRHSVVARWGFKHVWTRIIPRALERSTYVLLASLAFVLLLWQWRPIPYVIRRVGDPSGAWPLMALQALGLR